MTTTTNTTTAPAKSARVAPTAPKSAPKATPKATTDKAQAARLVELVAAVKTGYSTITGLDTKVSELESVYTTALNTRDNGRVATARALAALAKHPGSHAKGGATKGQPALSVVATLTGFQRNTLRPLWEGSEALTAKGWERRTSAPTEAERKLVAGFYAEKSAVRVESNKAKAATVKSGESTSNAKGTSAKTLKAGTLEDVVSILDDAHKVASTFAKNHGLTDKQLSALAAKLDAIHDVLESATATATAKAAK